MKFYLMLALTLVLAACGGNNATNAHNDDHDHENGHGDEHGETHAMGEKDLGDGYKIKAAHAEVEGSKEAVFEVQVLKDGKPLKDAEVFIWIGNKAGDELVVPMKGDWMAKEELYDCHVKMPKDHEGAMMWAKVRHAGKEMKASFDMPKDEH